MHTWLPFTLIYLDMSVLRDVVTLLTISFAMLDFRKFQLLEHLCIYIYADRERDRPKRLSLAARSKCSNEPRGPKTKAHHGTFVPFCTLTTRC